MGPSTLPPQAYTRDILAKAYLWAQSQPDSIKKLATTPDALVGLFLRAQRNGDISFENVAPVSRDNFMNDLKSLATELDQFDVPGQINKTHSHPPANAIQINVQTSPAQTPSANYPQHQAQQLPPNGASQFFNLDNKSKELIQDVKSHLNLSSDTEVIRLLIVLGYEKAKAIFPTK